jgi:8-hydroxy-5-deazaflavin:NADPH oxidoreductase
MKVGTIGMGKISSRLARKFAGAGYHVWVANSQGPESVRELAIEIGVEAVTAEVAVADSRVVVVSIPQ